MSAVNTNYFPTPNEFFLWDCLLESSRCTPICSAVQTDTHQCWPSYKTIGAATQMSVNTVRKHVCSLADKALISTEDTTIFTKTGLKRNGSLLYTIQPFQKVLDDHHQTELRQLEVSKAKWEYAKTVSL